MVVFEKILLLRIKKSSFVEKEELLRLPAI